MKIKIFTIFLMLISLLFIACAEDSPTEPTSSSNSVTITGDFSKSFDANCIAGMYTGDSLANFTVILQPKGSDINSGFYSDNALIFGKYTNTLPAVGKYNIGTGVETGADFYAMFFVNDSTIYFMYDGTVEITKSSSENISGKFDMQAGYLDFINPIPTRIINVKGQFSAKPMNF